MKEGTLRFTQKQALTPRTDASYHAVRLTWHLPCSRTR